MSTPGSGPGPSLAPTLAGVLLELNRADNQDGDAEANVVLPLWTQLRHLYSDSHDSWSFRSWALRNVKTAPLDLACHTEIDLSHGGGDDDDDDGDDGDGSSNVSSSTNNNNKLSQSAKLHTLCTAAAEAWDVRPGVIAFAFDGYDTVASEPCLKALCRIRKNNPALALAELVDAFDNARDEWVRNKHSRPARAPTSTTFLRHAFEKIDPTAWPKRKSAGGKAAATRRGGKMKNHNEHEDAGGEEQDDVRPDGPSEVARSTAHGHGNKKKQQQIGTPKVEQQQHHQHHGHPQASSPPPLQHNDGGASLAPLVDPELELYSTPPPQSSLPGGNLPGVGLNPPSASPRPDDNPHGTTDPELRGGASDLRNSGRAHPQDDTKADMQLADGQGTKELARVNRPATGLGKRSASPVEPAGSATARKRRRQDAQPSSPIHTRTSAVNTGTSTSTTDIKNEAIELHDYGSSDMEVDASFTSTQDVQTCLKAVQQLLGKRELLQGDKWLHDEVIHLLLSRLETDLVGVIDSLHVEQQPSSAHRMRRRLANKQAIIIPAHDRDAEHWRVYYCRPLSRPTPERTGEEGKEWVLECYDSMVGEDRYGEEDGTRHHHDKTTSKVWDLLRTIFELSPDVQRTVYQAPCPQQPNGYDCGPYIVEVAYHLAAAASAAASASVSASQHPLAAIDTTSTVGTATAAVPHHGPSVLLDSSPLDSAALRRRLTDILLTSESATLPYSDILDEITPEDLRQILCALSHRLHAFKKLEQQHPPPLAFALNRRRTIPLTTAAAATDDESSRGGGLGRGAAVPLPPLWDVDVAQMRRLGFISTMRRFHTMHERALRASVDTLSLLMDHDEEVGALSAFLRIRKRRRSRGTHSAPPSGGSETMQVIEHLVGQSIHATDVRDFECDLRKRVAEALRMSVACIVIMRVAVRVGRENKWI